ncbi:hypothetical protein SAMN05421754_102735, partial [Nitrosomonas sp. Nm58]
RRRGIPLYRTSRRIVFLSNALRPKADYYAHFKVLQEAIGIRFVLKSQCTIIGVSDNDDITLSLFTTPLMCPEIEHVVKVDVGKQRGNYCSLRRSPLRLRSHLPFSTTPTVSHFRISRMIRLSPILCCKKRITQL